MATYQKCHILLDPKKIDDLNLLTENLSYPKVTNYDALLTEY